VTRKHESTIKKGAVLTNPERVIDSYLDFEDAMDFLRLKTDAIRET
jgi:hypothetical protein